MSTDSNDGTTVEQPDEEDGLVPQPHGGALRFWPKGTSVSPAGRPRNRVVTMLYEAIDDDATAQAVNR